MAKNKKTIDLKTPTNRLQYVKMIKKGQFLHNNKDYTQALKYLTTAWKYDDSDPNLLIMVSDGLFKIGNKMAAMDLMAHALQKNPNDANIASILGLAAYKMNFFELAEKFHTKYIELMPDDPVGYNNYVGALREQGKYDEAIALLQDILPIFPEAEMLWNSLGSIVAFRDGLGASILFYEECLKLNPNNSQALNNIAPAYATIKEGEKSEAATLKSIELNPEFEGPHMYYASFLLHKKRLEEGWKEYQWRFKEQDRFAYTVKHNNIPYWQGENLKGKKIFIFAEQGIGDELLFSWLNHEIIKEAEHVGFGCEKRLVPLFKSSFPTSEVSSTEARIERKLEIGFDAFPDINVEEYDYQCVAGDIAKIKWQKYEDIKASSSPIFTPNPEKVDYWKKEIEKLPHEISIGISWRSGIKFARRARNYTTLLNWEPFLKQKNVNFINTQYGDCDEELKELEEKTGIKIHNFKDLDLKDDFESTIAMMKNLDLCMGPGSAPQMQSSMAGIETWFIITGFPFWAFGEEIPIWRQNTRIISKSDNDPWPEFMNEKAQEFKKWIKDKRKSKK